jgi:hypothetical protein
MERSPLGGGGVDCMSDIFILNEILVQGKIYILRGTLIEIFYLPLSNGGSEL